MLCGVEEGGLWVDREGFRAPWVEAETFGRRRMPVIKRCEMQRFADHVTGYRRDDAVAKDVFKMLYPDGAAVRVKEGAFASFTGRIESHDDRIGVYTVAVEIFGRETPVQLEEKQLEVA